MDNIADYKQVCSENQTYDFGTQVVDVAYGANSNFVFKPKVTGKVEFSNKTFGDPIIGVHKFGYFKLSQIVNPTKQETLDAIAKGIPVDFRNHQFVPVRPGCIEGISDDGGWENTSEAGYINWIKTSTAKVWNFDYEPDLSTPEARKACSDLVIHVAGLVKQYAPDKVFTWYGGLGGEYWPYINWQDPNWQSGRDRIITQNNDLKDAYAVCDVLTTSIYQHYDGADSACFGSDALFTERNIEEAHRVDPNKSVLAEFWVLVHESPNNLLSLPRTYNVLDTVKKYKATLSVWSADQPDRSDLVLDYVLKANNMLDGYTQVANENESYNFGTSIVDVAYGANDKFIFKTGLTGRVTFSNATFGDPISGTRKAGWYKYNINNVITPTELQRKTS